MAPDVYDKLGVLLLDAPTDKRHLRFAGGEPLLVFDIWEPFARRMLKHSGTTVEVLTNLRNTPDNFWEFAELDDVNISISVDNGETVKVLKQALVSGFVDIKNSDFDVVREMAKRTNMPPFQKY